MFFETIDVIRRNFFLFAVCLIAAWFCMQFTNQGPRAVLYLYMAYGFQSAILSGGKFKSAKWVGGFFWRGLVLLGFSFVLMFAVIPFVSPVKGLATLEILAFVAIAVPAVFALFGIWPTSYLDGPGISITQALRRSLQRFPSTYARLLAGTALPIILNLPLGMLAPSNLYVGGSLSISFIVLSFLSVTIDAFGNTYVSVVLARKYLSTKPVGRISDEISPVPA